MRIESRRALDLVFWAPLSTGGFSGGSTTRDGNGCCIHLYRLAGEALPNPGLHRALRTLPLVFALMLALPAHALASGTAAAAPTAKVLYHDGYTGRYLLDGTWYLRLDPLDQGLAQGFQRQASLTGWGAITVPNAWNATDLSDASQRGAWPGTARTSAAGGDQDHVLDGALRIGELPGAGLPQRAPDRHARGRVHAVRGPAAQRPQEGREPPGGAGGQPPVGHGPAAARGPDNGTPGGGWWNYGGLLREVYLRKVDRVDIELRGPADPPLPCLRRQRAGPGHAPQLDGKKRKAGLHASVGGLAAHFRLVTLPARGTRQVRAKVTIPTRACGRPGDPQLYRVSCGEVRPRPGRATTCASASARSR